MTAKPFVADQFIEEAQRATGLERFDSDSFREGLEILLADFSKLDTPEELLPLTTDAIVEALANRLKVTVCAMSHLAQTLVSSAAATEGTGCFSST